MSVEISAKEFNERMKAASADIAGQIVADGGPRNRFQEAFVDLAEAAGNSDKEIEAVATGLRPKITP